MLLSNTAIFAALDDGRLVIEPEPTPREPEQSKKSPYDSTAINLTLGNVLNIPKDSLSIVYDISAGNVSETLATTYNKKTLADGESFILSPNTLITWQYEGAY